MTDPEDSGVESGVESHSEATSVNVVVSGDMCIGAGQCEMFEEETFLVDEDTMVSTVIGSGLLPRDRATRVVETCPSGAISIVEPGVEA